MGTVCSPNMKTGVLFADCSRLNRPQDIVDNELIDGTCGIIALIQHPNDERLISRRIPWEQATVPSIPTPVLPS